MNVLAKHGNEPAQSIFHILVIVLSINSLEGEITSGLTVNNLSIISRMTSCSGLTSLLSSSIW